jgi:uracil-DNA glycosylase
MTSTPHKASQRSPSGKASASSETSIASKALPASLRAALALADPSWQPHLVAGLEAIARVHPRYLDELATDDYLPTKSRLFAAFAQPLAKVRYILVGEGPYPRADSATGVCFMDGAVGSLWSEAGLSKPVNRATSLRNFKKMVLFADGQLHRAATGATALAPVAARALAGAAIGTLPELQANLTTHGFLLLNASLVFRHHVAPAIDGRAWLPFLQVILGALADAQPAPTIILWGKLAEQLGSLPEAARLPQARAEHPYNLSFIDHAGMQALFGPLKLLKP